MTSLSSIQDLRVILLGDFEVRLRGHSVTGAFHNKMRALLAYLVIERERDHNREMLANLLWGDKDGSTGRDNLRRTLLKLRHALESPTGPELFSATKHTIRFIPNASIDVVDFTAREPDASPPCPEEKLIALYRGEFLAGLSLPDSPDFEDWLKIQREALHRRALAMLEQLSNRYAQTGDYGKALQFALRLAEMEPWDESAHRKAMRLYALNGQNSAALQQYEICSRLLQIDLGISPSEETRQLASDIRNGEVRRRQVDIVNTEPPTARAPNFERRQITVLYCELIPAPATDDPDETLERLRAPLARCEHIARQFSGHPVQTHDGGLLAYFGYPHARENAARRAVAAALSMTGETTADMRITASAHTGLVISDGDTARPDTAGLASKLAIHLRHHIDTDEVVISQETHRLAGDFFTCASLGVQTLPGFARPLEIFTVARESGVRTRLDATAHLTPLAGRQREIAALTELWEKAAQGASQTVLIQGEPGIGKSRLLYTLKQRLRVHPIVIYELHCFEEFSQSPFYPLVQMLETIFDFDPTDTPQLKLDKLEHYLNKHYPDSASNAAQLLAQLLPLPAAGQPSAPDISPQSWKEQTTGFLVQLLQTHAEQLPILLIVEDLHWSDPSTLEVLTRLAEQQSPRALLAVFTARPEFVPHWRNAAHTTLSLAPLTDSEVEQIITSINDTLPTEMLRRIVQRADGIALFAEEMAKIADMDSQAGIPATLHDLLASRMDALGEAKHIAQLAATLGREFDLDLIGKISPCTPAALAGQLNVLRNAGLILQQNGNVFQFKHALIQEAAYQSQTRTDRQDAHRRIAQTLQAEFPDVAEHQPELLARHFAAAGETRQAIEYWINAGRRAARNSANTEAIKHFDNGLQLLAALPRNGEVDRLEVELRLHLGPALIAAKGYGAIEIGQNYSQTQDLCERLGDSAGLFTALWGMWLTSSSRTNHSHSMELAEKLLRMAEQDGDSLHRLQASYAMGNSLLWTGKIEPARRYLEQSIAYYRPHYHDVMVGNLGENICISSNALLTLTLWLSGHPRQAEDMGRRTLSLAREINHPHSLGFALCAVAMLNRWLKRPELTWLYARESIELSQQYGLPLWHELGTASCSWVQASHGEAASIARLRQCLDTANALMSGISGLFLALLNESRMLLGQFDEALIGLDQALAIMFEKHDHFFVSEFHRLKGLCLLEVSAGNPTQAEACFNRALTISRKQGATSLELRAALELARLWLSQGKPEDARLLLEETRGKFSEGFDAPDWQEAERLLQQAAKGR